MGGRKVRLMRCDKCSFKTLYASALRMHSRYHSSEKPFKCPNLGCDYKTRWAQAVPRHQQWCRGEVEIPCGETSDGISIVAVDDKRRKALTKESFFQQGSITGEEAAYSCNFCSFSSTRKPVLTGHLAVHSGLSPAFRCPIQGCKYLAKWPQTVRKHSRLVHQIELLPKTPVQSQDNLGPVTECEAKVDASNSKQILKRSSTKNEFLCDKCGYIASYASNFLGHSRAHSIEESVKSPNFGCAYRTRSARGQAQNPAAETTDEVTIVAVVDKRSEGTTESSMGPVMESQTETEVDVNNNGSSMAFACMLCNFIGDSELSALKHSCQHRTVVVSLNRI